MDHLKLRKRRMYYPKCWKENREDTKFCLHCGVDLRKYDIERKWLKTYRKVRV